MGWRRVRAIFLLTKGERRGGQRGARVCEDGTGSRNERKVDSKPFLSIRCSVNFGIEHRVG